MRSATSSSKAGGLHPWFHPTLFRKNMTRFWPIWALYGVVWFLMLPVNLLTSYTGDGSYAILRSVDNMGTAVSGAQYFARCSVVSSTAAAVPLGVAFGILAAMAVFSYLYQSRSVGLMHALPLRREGLFLTNYLSGLTFFALPLAAVFLLTLGAEALAGAVYLPALFCWFFVNLLVALFFYSFAVFCAMFTGHILALPAFYGILNGLAAGLCWLFERLLGEFVYGFDRLPGLEAAAEWLTPALRLSGRLFTEAVSTPDGLGAYCLRGLSSVFLYAGVGLALSAAALAAYRRRQLECAGDVVSVRWVRPVFKYGVAFCAAVSLGMMLYQLFGANLPRGPWTLLIFLILGGAVGYFAAEMLLQKSFRVFSGGWRGMAAFSLALVAGVCCMVFDLTGFERRVPDPGRVVSVSFGSAYTTPRDEAGYASLEFTDPEKIELVTRLHAAAVADRSGRGDGETWADTARPSLQLQLSGSAAVNLFYTMADGSLVSRSYLVHLSEPELSDPGTAAGLLNELINRPDVVERSYFNSLDQFENVRLSDVSISVPVGSEEEGYSSTYQPLDLDADAKAELLEAIRADMAAGNLGRRYLLENEARFTNCYYNDLQLIFYVSGDKSGDGAYNSSPSVTITLQASAENTLRALTQHGFGPERLITVGEWYGRDPGELNAAQAELPADTVRALPAAG